MTTQDKLARLENLADEYANCAAKARLESLYGTSKSYTAECQREENEARSQLVKALAAHEAQAQAATSHMGSWCAEKRKPGGCQLHNLQCGYPACDQKPKTELLAAAPQPEAVQAENLPSVEHIRELAEEAMQQIMEQAQVFASAWSLVGGRFDTGNALDDAEDAKAELRTMVRSLADLAAQSVRPITLAAQQAEREPLTDEQIDARNPYVLSKNHASVWAAGFRAGERAHGIE